jgi:hypothetical protein
MSPITLEAENLAETYALKALLINVVAFGRFVIVDL